MASAGKASALGVNLWKAKYMLESVAYKDAIKELSLLYLDRYRREDRETAQKLVEQALSEYLAAFCQTCKGAREMVVNELKVVCMECDGSGIRRYTDYDRAVVLKMSLQRVKSLARKMQWLAEQIGTLDRDVNMVLKFELERGLYGK